MLFIYQFSILLRPLMLSITVGKKEIIDKIVSNPSKLTIGPDGIPV